MHSCVGRSLLWEDVMMQVLDRERENERFGAFLSLIAIQSPR